MKDLIDPALETYAEAHSWPESDVCRAVREETYRVMDCPQMVVGPLEGAFLKVMAVMSGARRVLEIGTFTGYSALCFAESIPEDGQVLTCEIDAESAGVARRYFAKSPYGSKIEIKLGPALETLNRLTGPFDLVFIDADKANYLNYYRRAVDLVRAGGLILIDNVLWSSEVIRHPPPDGATAAIQEVNRAVSADPRVQAVLVTIRDGVFVVRKRPEDGRST